MDTSFKSSRHKCVHASLLGVLRGAIDIGPFTYWSVLGEILYFMNGCEVMDLARVQELLSLANFTNLP
ncbi:hypothetical protein Tco_1436840 [Tanacetum coccineum]